MKIPTKERRKRSTLASRHTPDELRALVDRGLTDDEIGARLEPPVTGRSVRIALQGYGIARPPSPGAGTHPPSVLVRCASEAQREALHREAPWRATGPWLLSLGLEGPELAREIRDLSRSQAQRRASLERLLDLLLAAEIGRDVAAGE